MNKALKSLIISLIELYQRTLSPDHGWNKAKHPTGYCKYYPSCSEYTKQSVQKYGLFGLFKGFYRVLRCNPFTKGGIDLA